jgi:hypothetical protein
MNANGHYEQGGLQIFFRNTIRKPDGVIRFL